MGKTVIQWTDRVWNPVRGCSMVSAGCENCYAMRQAHRFSGQGQPYANLTEVGPHGPRWNGKVTLHPELLDLPLRWRKPSRIFVNSMSDLFHEDVPDSFIDSVFAVMSVTPRHTYQILTKRPERMRAYIRQQRHGYIWAQAYKINGIQPPSGRVPPPFPYPNVHLIVSCEDQKTADERIPILIDTPAAVRGVSLEPLIGPVDLSSIGGKKEPRRLDWVIVGGESGPNARPMHPDWVRSIRDQCHAAGTAFFFKQWGAWKPICEMYNKESSALYKSNKKARQHEDQDVIDELYGKHCTVKSRAVRFDGEAFPSHSGKGYELINGHPGMLCFKVGTKKAGRTLDGQEYNEFPGVSYAI